MSKIRLSIKGKDFTFEGDEVKVYASNEDGTETDLIKFHEEAKEGTPDFSDVANIMKRKRHE